MSDEKKFPSSWPYEEGSEEITADQRIIFKIARNKIPFSKLSEILLSSRVEKIPRWQLLTHGVVLNAIDARLVIMFIRQIYYNLTKKDLLPEIMLVQPLNEEEKKPLTEEQVSKLQKLVTEFIRRAKTRILN